MYSNKHGLILVDEHNIYNFSFQKWDWKTFQPLNFKPRIHLKNIYRKSSYVMIDENNLFMTLPRGNAYIANLNTFRSIYTVYSDYGTKECILIGIKILQDRVFNMILVKIAEKH